MFLPEFSWKKILVLPQLSGNSQRQPGRKIDNSEFTENYLNFGGKPIEVFKEMQKFSRKSSRLTENFGKKTGTLQRKQLTIRKFKNQ